MRSFLRKACLALSLASLLFFLSCERHHVDELPGEVKAETKAPAKQSDQSDQSTATTNPSPTAEPRQSPANFFPEKKKP